MKKRVWGLIKKEFIHIFRDKRTLFMIFGIPLVEILLFGYVIRTDISNIQVGVVDRTHDQISQDICNKLEGSSYFDSVVKIDKIEDADRLFRQNKIQELIVFDLDLECSTVNREGGDIGIILDGSNPTVSQLILNYTSSVIGDYLGVENHSLIRPQYRMVYNEELKSTYMFVPGVMALVLLLISAMMTAITLTKEKENHSFEMLLISPIRPIEVIIGKVTPYLILSFINGLLILVLSKLLFGLPFLGSNVLLFGVILLYILLSLSIGIFISVVADTQIVAMLFSLVVLLMPTMLLSGFIFPVANMPMILQWISNLMPAKWFIICFKGVVIQGFGLEGILKPFLVLLGMTLFFMVLSVKKYNVHLDD
ncbi:ABC transporter permease [Halosquirtibacter laminarini]|uniref:ABC transporter permease n=1 Tax=Halosquirtibacter laminarini TaxID=3374600 RepID=A0AC61NIQ5_9BACT|nr:ABC transporter permease [Prolixibacteraceae bacterium]